MENNKKNIWGHTQNAQINAARSINSDTHSKSAHDKFETDSIIWFYAKSKKKDAIPPTTRQQSVQ